MCQLTSNKLLNRFDIKLPNYSLCDISRLRELTSLTSQHSITVNPNEGRLRINNFMTNFRIVCVD